LQSGSQFGKRKVSQICFIAYNLVFSGIEKEQALQNLTEFTFSHNHCRAIIQLDVIPELVSLLHQDNKMASDSLQCLLNISRKYLMAYNGYFCVDF
jgi:hypothetical protein